jgi:ribonuclease HII
MLKTRFREDSAIEAGVDEVGRGCLWGPLVAVALIWPPESEWTDEIRTLAEQIKDSKKLTEKKRTSLASSIKDYAIDFGVGVVEPNEIDDLGMTLANQTAFSRAVQALTVEPDRLMIDGIIPIPMTLCRKEQHMIIEGDGKYIPIAAASIVGKDYRDTFVKAWATTHQETATRYDLASNKGYGTAKHRQAIQTHGRLSEHRTLFLRKILGESVYTAPSRKPKQSTQQCQIQDELDIED